LTRQVILEKALELFTEKGYDAASMDDIAKAVGIRKASLYAHFEGKERIFLEIYHGILEEYTRVIDALTAPSAEGAIEALERIFMEYLVYCHESRRMNFWDRYFYHPPAFAKELITRTTQETQDVFLNRIRLWMERGMAFGVINNQPPERAALAYYYLMIGLSMSVRMFSREEMLLEARSAWEGLKSGLEKV
jgi:AcrR family transcriptional regulator